MALLAAEALDLRHVMPSIPAAARASFTSSSLNGLMMAMMSFMGKGPSDHVTFFAVLVDVEPWVSTSIDGRKPISALTREARMTVATIASTRVIPMAFNCSSQKPALGHEMGQAVLAGGRVGLGKVRIHRAGGENPGEERAIVPPRRGPRRCRGRRHSRTNP